jgi:hypothetical protein
VLPPGDAISRAREDASRRLRSWSAPVLGFLLFLCGAFTLLTVMTGFFLVFLGMTVVVYAFAAFVIVRSYRPARRDVAYLDDLLNVLRGEILEARALDPPDEIPHGRAVLVLDNGLVVHLDEPRLRFLRLYSATGTALRPTIQEAWVWATARSAVGVNRITIPEKGTPLPSSPELDRIATKWSWKAFEVSFRSLPPPRDAADKEAQHRTFGEVRSSATLEVRETRVTPAEIAAEMDAVRDLLDTLRRSREP